MENEEFQQYVFEAIKNIEDRLLEIKDVIDEQKKESFKTEVRSKYFRQSYKKYVQSQNEQFFRLSEITKGLSERMNRPYSFAPKKTLASKIFKFFGGK